MRSLRSMGKCAWIDFKCDIFGARHRIWHAQNPAKNQQPWFRIARKAEARQDGVGNAGVISRDGVFH